MNSSNPSRFERAQPGFALIVTLSLMILLTVIAVGLLTLSSLTLRSTSQGEAAAAARANARLALMMAIGELQREMGPDSRISAAHDAGTVAKGGQPHWTAVYDAWRWNTSGAETPNSRGTPRFRAWLASGANQATGGPAGTPEKVELFGPGSLGGVTTPSLRVQVPMHVMKTSGLEGRVAWWVADEGSKAKINAGPDDFAESTLGKADPLFDSQSPPYLGHQMLPPLADFDWEDGQRGKSLSQATVVLAAGVEKNALGSLA
ncbi:MAG TPA: hypothetical protein VLD18_01750, partial [Verrucomicrobiae bacterium]|nr:hypothetical protein [Verrucomicrobiae bacterium]